MSKPNGIESSSQRQPQQFGLKEDGELNPETAAAFTFPNEERSQETGTERKRKRKLNLEGHIQDLLENDPERREVLRDFIADAQKYLTQSRDAQTDRESYQKFSRSYALLSYLPLIVMWGTVMITDLSVKTELGGAVGGVIMLSLLWKAALVDFIFEVQDTSKPESIHNTHVRKKELKYRKAKAQASEKALAAQWENLDGYVAVLQLQQLDELKTSDRKKQLAKIIKQSRQYFAAQEIRRRAALRLAEEGEEPEE